MNQLTRHLKPSTPLIAILLLAGTLRFVGITERGVHDYDEAWYLLEAKTLYYTGDYLLSTIGLSDVDTSVGLKQYVKQRGTVPMTSVKPGHTILTFLGMLVVGTNDYAGLGVSAVAGLLTVFLVHLIGCELGDRRLGLAAALVLAISPLHIHYSRSMYAQSNAVFLATLGAYLWVRFHRKDGPWLGTLFAAGLAVGYAFTCHFNLAWITVGFVALEAWISRVHRKSVRVLISRITALGAGMALPATLFEIGGQIAKFIGLFPQDYPTYLGQFLHRQNLAERIVLSTRQVPFWTDRFLATEGLLVACLFLVGLGFLIGGIRRQNLKHVTLAGLLGMALLPTSLLAVDGLYFILRNFAIALPAVALVSAYGLVTIGDLLRANAPSSVPFAAAAVSVFLIAGGCIRTMDVLDLRSTYAEAASNLVSQIETDDGVLATRPLSAWPIWYFYLSGEYDRASDDTRERIRFYPDGIQAGDYELVDVKSYHRALVVNDTNAIEAYGQLRETTPLVRIRNPAADIPERFFEGGGEKAESVFDALKNEYEGSRNIEIYDLRTSAIQANVWNDQGEKG